MAPIVEPIPITMTTLAGIAFLPSSIYEESTTVTFTNVADAYATVDILLSKLTNISSWC